MKEDYVRYDNGFGAIEKIREIDKKNRGTTNSSTQIFIETIGTLIELFSKDGLLKKDSSTTEPIYRELPDQEDRKPVEAFIAMLKVNKKDIEKVMGGKGSEVLTRIGKDLSNILDRQKKDMRAAGKWDEGMANKTSEYIRSIQSTISAKENSELLRQLKDIWLGTIQNTSQPIERLKRIPSPKKRTVIAIIKDKPSLSIDEREILTRPLKEKVRDLCEMLSSIKFSEHYTGKDAAPMFVFADEVLHVYPHPRIYKKGVDKNNLGLTSGLYYSKTDNQASYRPCTSLRQRLAIFKTQRGNITDDDRRRSSLITDKKGIPIFNETFKAKLLMTGVDFFSILKKLCEFADIRYIQHKKPK